MLFCKVEGRPNKVMFKQKHKENELARNLGKGFQGEGIINAKALRLPSENSEEAMWLGAE